MTWSGLLKPKPPPQCRILSAQSPTPSYFDTAQKPVAVVVGGGARGGVVGAAGVAVGVVVGLGC